MGRPSILSIIQLCGKTITDRCYGSQRSCGKVMFLHLSVILFTSIGVYVQEGVSVQGGLCPGGSLSRGVSVHAGICPGGLCRKGSLSRETPSYGNVWAVHILLECIFVFKVIHLNKA